MTNTKTRNPEIDAARGIAIVLMVGGHSWLPFWCNTSFIGLFHMSLFMMISGYCMSDRHMTGAKEIRHFVISRIKGLYLPYAVANSVYILLNNLFIQMNIYCASSEQADLILPGIGPDVWMTLPETIKQIVLSFLFIGYSPRMGGATWFLRALFCISIFFCISGYFLQRNGKRMEWQLILGVFLLVLWGVDQVHPFMTIGSFSQICLYYWAYAMGYCLRKHKSVWETAKRKTNILAVLVCYLALQGMVLMNAGLENALNREQVTGVSVIGFGVSLAAIRLISGILAWGLVLSAALLIVNTGRASGKWIRICGQGTLEVLLLHFLCFKVITLLYVAVYRLSVFYLGATPVLPDLSWGWGCLYIAAGTGIPVVIHVLRKQLRSLSCGKMDCKIRRG